MANNYTFNQLVEVYAALGVTSGQVVYVVSDMVSCADFITSGRGAVLHAHYEALRKLLGSEGTIVVPTASLNLCNTSIPFCVRNTKSHMVGAFSEFVRQLPNAHRSFHPFVSYTAIGARAEALTEGVSRHAFGPNTPEAHLIAEDALTLSIGKPPHITCSTVHHVEQMTSVPYRYTKEFLHPVVRDGLTRLEPFYMHVRYLNSDVERNYNRKLFDCIGAGLDVRSGKLGRGTVWSYSTRRFFDLSLPELLNDPYLWCDHEPHQRPWRI